MKKNTFRYVCVAVYAFVSLLLLKLLHPYIIKSVFEYEYLGTLPWWLRETEGLSGLRLLGYLLAPYPMGNEIAILKIYAVSVYRMFGPLAGNYVFVSLLLHFAASVLLYWLCKMVQLGRRISFFASLIYISISAHVYAYVDPMATQHLITVVFILLGLNFYLKCDRLIDSRAATRHVFYALTLLVNVAASFCIVSVLILPAIVFAHILLCSEDGRQRLRKYTIWLPLFIVYLVYPLLPVAFGHARIMNNVLLPRCPMLAEVFLKLKPLVKFSIMFLSSLSCLIFFRQILRIYSSRNLKRFLRPFLLTLSAAAAVFLLVTGGPKRLLIPYNIFAPFVGITASFLWPMQNVFLASPSHAWYPVPLQLNVFNFLLCIFILTLFVKHFAMRNRQFVILGIWYAGSMLWFYLINPVYSRYFIYLSPVFCVVFAAAADYLCARLDGRKYAALFIITILCITNIFAIRFMLFRGKLTNAFLSYDTIRAAELIRRDLVSSGRIHQLKAKRLCVNNAVPMAFDLGIPGYPEGYRFDPRNDNERFVFMRVFGDTSLNVVFNQAQQDLEECITYSFDTNGPYERLFEEGIKNLQSNSYAQALVSFKEALRARPFMFDYILGGLGPEEGLEWITGGDDMRQWVEKIRCFWAAGGLKKFNEKINHVAFVLNKEIDTYILSLFYISFLEHSKGNAKESILWFSKIRLFENEFAMLHGWLSEQHLVKSKKDIADFLNSRKDNALRFIASRSRVERCKFARSLFKLSFN